MVKTTLYLPEELKAALEREAARIQQSEAELIRATLWERLGAPERPAAHFGEYEGTVLSVEEMRHPFGESFGAS